MTEIELTCREMILIVFADICNATMKDSDGFWPPIFKTPLTPDNWGGAVDGDLHGGGRWIPSVVALAEFARTHPVEFERVRQEMYVWHVLKYGDPGDYDGP